MPNANGTPRRGGGNRCHNMGMIITTTLDNRYDH